MIGWGSVKWKGEVAVDVVVLSITYPPRTCDLGVVICFLNLNLSNCGNKGQCCQMFSITCRQLIAIGDTQRLYFRLYECS